MLRTYLPAALALLAVAAAAATASSQQSGFSGAWKLNLNKSSMAAEHTPSDYELTRTLAQDGSQLTITDNAAHQAMMNIPMPDSRTTTTLIADGQAHAGKGTPFFPGLPAPDVEISAEWQGGTLFVTERGSGFGGLTTTHFRYYLSAGGSELIDLVDSHSTFGDSEQRLVFDKQP